MRGLAKLKVDLFLDGPAQWRESFDSPRLTLPRCRWVEWRETSGLASMYHLPSRLISRTVRYLLKRCEEMGERQVLRALCGQTCELGLKIGQPTREALGTPGVHKRWRTWVRDLKGLRKQMEIRRTDRKREYMKSRSYCFQNLHPGFFLWGAETFETVERGGGGKCLASSSESGGVGSPDVKPTWSLGFVVGLTFGRCVAPLDEACSEGG